MSFELKQSLLFCFCNEFELKPSVCAVVFTLISSDSDRNINLAPILFINQIWIESIRIVDIIIQDAGTFVCFFDVVVEAAHFKLMLHIQPSNIHRIRRRSIVVILRSICSPFPTQSIWSVFCLLAEQIFSNDQDGAAGGSYVLLCSCVHDTELFPVDWARSDIRTHITHNCHSFNQMVGEVAFVELEAVNCFVLAIMKIRRILVNFPFRFRLDLCKLGLFSVSWDDWFLPIKHNFSLINTQLRP